MGTYTRALLGRTGVEVGRLGLAASYGVPAAAVERAFERGVNYLYWGSYRTPAFAQALRALKPQRERVVLVLQSYSRLASLVSWSIERGLRRIGYDCADVLLLGMWNGPVPERIMDAAREARRRGLVRYLAFSTHKRSRVTAAPADFDVVHFRYNAVHPGAERDIFPNVRKNGRAGLVSFTATSWGQLLDPRRIPAGERAPSASDCYRYVLTRPEVDVCLSGPSSSAHMEEALRALESPSMDEEELAWMRRVGAAIYRKALFTRE